MEFSSMKTRSRRRELSQLRKADKKVIAFLRAVLGSLRRIRLLLRKTSISKGAAQTDPPATPEDDISPDARQHGTFPPDPRRRKCPLVVPSRWPSAARCSPLPLGAQGTSRLPERAVRRDIPMTNAIRRAFAAGTRDSTGGRAATTGSCAPTTRSTRASIRRRRASPGARRSCMHEQHARSR